MSEANQIFSQNQMQTLAAAMNRIIPADGDMPAAGDLGLAKFVERAAAESPGKIRLFTQGLATIEVTCSQLSGKSFPESTEQDQLQILQSVEFSNAVFFDELVRQTYNGYYTNPGVFQTMGYSNSQPDISGQPDLLDESLLERQRQRPPFWTKA